MSTACLSSGQALTSSCEPQQAPPIAAGSRASNRQCKPSEHSTRDDHSVHTSLSLSFSARCASFRASNASRASSPGFLSGCTRMDSLRYALDTCSGSDGGATRRGRRWGAVVQCTRLLHGRQPQLLMHGHIHKRGTAPHLRCGDGPGGAAQRIHLWRRQLQQPAQQSGQPGGTLSRLLPAASCCVGMHGVCHAARQPSSGALQMAPIWQPRNDPTSAASPEVVSIFVGQQHALDGIAGRHASGHLAQACLFADLWQAERQQAGHEQGVPG